jgi:DNA-binding winged helix-turn-helix (wHTH) protein
LASGAQDEPEFQFGDCLLVPRSRLMLRDGRPVCIGSRAFDLLHALLKSPGRLVCKEDLVKQVWPSTLVEESNLRFQMSCLRKALGSQRHLIKTIPGRGYVFTGDCRRVQPRAISPPALGPSTSAAPCRDLEEGPRSGRLLQFQRGSGARRAETRSEPDPNCVWHLAVSFMPVSAGAGAGSDGNALLSALSAALSDRSAPTGRSVELVLPMLVLSGAELAQIGAAGHWPSHVTAMFDVGALLELLQPSPGNG